MKLFLALLVLHFCGAAIAGLSDDVKKTLLAAHNRYRGTVSPIASNMMRMGWSEKLETIAQGLADECALKQSATLNFESGSVTENRYARAGSIADYAHVVSLWFDAKDRYAYEENSCAKGCERYTAMVQASANYIGCAENQCSGFQGMSRLKGTLFVCAYGPVVAEANSQPYATGSRVCESCPSDYVCKEGLCSLMDEQKTAHATTLELNQNRFQLQTVPVNETSPTAPPPPPSPPVERPVYTDLDKKRVILTKQPLLQPKAGTALYNALVQYFKEVAIIVHTVNENEYWATLDRLAPPKSSTIPQLSSLNSPVIFPFKGTVLGTFGGYKAAVVQTLMGAECRDEIEEALDRFPQAQAIIGVGVAYGSKKYQFCDVLVSKWIEDLSTVKFDGEGNIVTRGEKLEMRPQLVNIFAKQIERFAIVRNFTCTESGRAPKVAPGIIISASWLVDNGAIKSEIFENAPEAVGGEMEGWVLTSIERKLRNKNPPRNIGVIIIKGLADYGDGTKSREWQFTAAKAAVDYAEFQLQDAGEGGFPIPGSGRLASLNQEESDEDIDLESALKK